MMRYAKLGTVGEAEDRNGDEKTGKGRNKK
jgi:hypothetical protein